MASRPTETLACPMCGCSFDAARHGACASCPLHDGCSVVCCPACGYSAVDPERSEVVRLGARIAGRLGLRRRKRPRGPREVSAGTLAEVLPGCRARVAQLHGLPAARQEYLQAYGIAPGRWVQVLQRSPVTVVRIEHTDIAFELEIARGVQVEAVEAGSP